MADPAADPSTRDRIGDVSVTRVVDAPRSLVWKAWTERGHVAAWWGPHGFSTPRCDWEARVGGSIRIDMKGPDGSVHRMDGGFREVEPETRLVFESSVPDPTGRVLFEVLTTVTLADVAGGSTLVTVEGRVLSAAPEARPFLSGAQVGWTQSVERLQAYTEALREGHAPQSVPTRRPDAGTTLSLPSDREIVLERTFDAPKWLVYLAWTRPEHFAAWWGPRELRNTIHEMDVRPGGTWRVTQQAPDGTEHPFRGTYREVSPPDRLVFTQVYLPHPDDEVVCTLTLDDAGGRTSLRVSMRFASQQSRDGMMRAGAEGGLRQSMQRLDEDLLARTLEASHPWPGGIVAVRRVHAPRELVWRMWTEPQHLAGWWGPQGFRTTVHHMDLRAGGQWRFTMHGPDGNDYENTMVYADVQPHERLVYTHTVPPVFRQVVTLSDGGAGWTRVAVASTFENADDVQPWAVAGMDQTLDRLTERVAASAD